MVAVVIAPMQTINPEFYQHMSVDNIYQGINNPWFWILYIVGSVLFAYIILWLAFKWK
jgi:hypothetical protein